jgi:phosphoribosylformylglycinamidine cyclo-ligase
MLPDGLAAAIDTSAWRIPPIFELLRRLGRVPEDDYRRTFNLGVGMVLAVGRAHARKAQRILDKASEPFIPVGSVVARRRGPRVDYR